MPWPGGRAFLAAGRSHPSPLSHGSVSVKGGRRVTSGSTPISAMHFGGGHTEGPEPRNQNLMAATFFWRDHPHFKRGDPQKWQILEAERKTSLPTQPPVEQLRSTSDK